MIGTATSCKTVFVNFSAEKLIDHIGFNYDFFGILIEKLVLLFFFIADPFVFLPRF